MRKVTWAEPQIPDFQSEDKVRREGEPMAMSGLTAGL